MYKYFAFLVIAMLISCKSETQKKRDLAHRICNSYNSEILSFTSDLIESNEFIKTTIEPIDVIANCIKSDIEDRLIESYSIEELEKIDKYNSQKIAVINGLLNNANFQKNAFDCIKSTFKEYEKTSNKIENSIR